MVAFRLENGRATIAIGTYAKALRVLELDVDAAAGDEEMNRKMEEEFAALALKARR